MANPSKRIGTRAETNVSRFLTERGLRTTRRALAGSEDEGDLRMLLPSGEEITLEVKAGKQTRSVSRSKLNEWKRQTEAESGNSGCRGALVIVKYQRALADAEVWLPIAQWKGGTEGWAMEYLDDFADAMYATS